MSEKEKATHRSDVRSTMVEGAVKLLARDGVEGTSFREVLAVSRAPRGSIYHHFPGGKSELLHAALETVSSRGLAVMEGTRGQAAPAVLERFLGLWRRLLDQSDLSAGCAVAAVTVAAGERELVDHAGAIFRSWSEQLADLFEVGGLTPSSATQFATLAIAATEGAVLLARSERSRQPFDEVSVFLLDLIRAL